MVDDQLTLPEAVALTAGRDYWHTQPVGRLGIPSIQLADGPHGLRKQRGSRGFETTAVPATCFPTASALAASWNVDLVREVGRALGAEARSEGVSILLGPGVNIKRTPLCGRNFEYFSEDPFLSSRLAAAWIGGVQEHGVGASLKHFAANNQEFRRYTVDARVDDRTLREIYLASFEYAVTHAKPATIMAAYNRLNGDYCTQNAELLTTILREEWGFEGAVISDWGATADRAKGIAAGLDLEMPGYAGQGDDEVMDAVHSGALSRDAVRRAAHNVLNLPRVLPGETYDAQAHHRLARRAAAEGTVLLTNNGLLPLGADQSVAIIGGFAKRPRYQGAGSSGVTPHRLDTLWQEFGRGTYAEGYTASGDVDEARLREAAFVAAEADVAVVIVGLPESYEVEGVDRTHLDLPPGHNALVERVAAVNDRTVVVVVSGAPVLMPWADRVGAIVQAYLGGQAAGGGLADVLSGQAEPGGRLAETFPYGLEALDVGPDAAEYREGVFVGYRRTADVAFPFGHGLSYTTFEWSDFEATPDRVSVTVTNTGSRRGSDVVQVYVRDIESTVDRPDRELKGFAKVTLDPGGSERVEIALDQRAFAFWDEGWVVEAGTFEILAGASSRDIRCRAEVELAGTRLSSRASTAKKPTPSADRYTIETPLGEIHHPAGRILLRTLQAGARFVFRSTPDSPMAAIAGRLLAESPPFMLPMMTQGILGRRTARTLVAIANNLTFRRRAQ